MGRIQTVSENESETELLSQVKAFGHGGAYIPIPQKYKGKNVKITVIE